MINGNEKMYEILSLLSNQLSPELKTQIIEILKKTTLSENDTIILTKFINDYFTIQAYRMNTIGINEELAIKIDEYLKKQFPIINECYIEPITPGKNFITNLLAQKNDNLIQENKSQQSKNNSLARVRMKNNTSYYDYDPDIENDFGKISGFVNTIAIILTVLVLGIALAIITTTLS